MMAMSFVFTIHIIFAKMRLDKSHDRQSTRFKPRLVSNVLEKFIPILTDVKVLLMVNLYRCLSFERTLTIFDE